MSVYERYAFEFTYSVDENHSEAYEEWLRGATMEWITTESLAGFHSEQNLLGSSPRVRLVFEFDTLVDWTRFVGSDTYLRHTERLRAMTDGLSTNLWEPTTIPLDANPRNCQSMTVRDSGSNGDRRSRLRRPADDRGPDVSLGHLDPEESDSLVSRTVVLTGDST